MATGWLETPLSLSGKRIWIAGHNGMVGQALLKRLAGEGCDILIASKRELDLRDQAATHDWVMSHKPDMVILAAAKVGGILANETYSAEFLYDNAMIAANVIHAAHMAGTQKLLFLGSSCIYPKEAEQPISERALLSGPLEPTNEAYAVAKIMGIKMCQAYRKQYGCDFISVMPCNLYGPHDRFDMERSHVIPALMMKAHEAVRGGAETFEIWGSGKARREFMHVDDMADAVVFALKNYSDAEILNIGAGEDIPIKELAEMIADITGFKGALAFDVSKPDGTLRKLMDGARLRKAGWAPKIPLKEGLEDVYAWYLGLEQAAKSA